MNERRALDRIVPPGGWLGLIMDPGQTLRIVDLEGKQVVDLVALSADNPLEKLSCVYSVMLNRTWKLTTDHVLYSNLAQAMFTITEDTVGRHYSGGGFCTAEINRVRYGVEESANCADNFLEALRPYGIDRADFVGEQDYAGAFAVTAGLGIDERVERGVGDRAGGPGGDGAREHVR